MRSHEAAVMRTATFYPPVYQSLWVLMVFILQPVSLSPTILQKPPIQLLAALIDNAAGKIYRALLQASASQLAEFSGTLGHASSLCATLRSEVLLTVLVMYL